MFSKLRVWDTEANNGVLIDLLLAESPSDRNELPDEPTLRQVAGRAALALPPRSPLQRFFRYLRAAAISAAMTAISD